MENNNKKNYCYDEVDRRGNKHIVFILFAILLFSLNLRAPLTTASIMLDKISLDLNLNDTQSGFMMTVPLLAFAFSSIFISNAGIKYGYTKTLIFSSFLLIIGTFTRLNFGYMGLLIGTLIIGFGISFGNVLIPSIIKLKFSHRLGLVTGLYSVVMGAFSSLSTGTAHFLSTNRGVYWKNILTVWVVLSIITSCVWLYHRYVNKDMLLSECDRRNFFERKEIFKSKIAWAIIIYMGMQSFLFYTVITWLPKILVLKGFDEEFAGFMITLFQVSALPFSLLVPIVASKMKNQKLIAIFVASGYLLGSGFLYFASSKSQVIVSIIIMAIGTSGSYAAAIILMELRSRNANTVAIISGISQSIGYLLASTGPVFVGYLFDHFNRIEGPIAVLAIVSLILVFAGVTAGKPGYIDD